MTEGASSLQRHEIYVAIGKYTDNRIPDILCCERDITILSEAVAKIPYGTAPSKRTIVTTADDVSDGGKTRVLQVMEEALQAVRPDDSLMVVVTCHGYSAAGETYLLPADATLDDQSSFIAFRWIRELLDETDCRFKLILVDACHAGDARMTLKEGLEPLSFDERAAGLDLLLTNSRAVAYATACTHEQVALIRPDDNYSIWMYALAAELESVAATASNNYLRVEDLLAAAAERTVADAKLFHDTVQTPYLVIKAEGLFPLGKPSPATASRRATRPGSIEDIARTTATAFEQRFSGAFGSSMHVQWDRATQKKLALQGYPLNNVVHLGAPGHQVRLAVLFDLMSKPNRGVGELFDLQGLAERYALDRVVLPRQGWNSEARRRAGNFDRLHVLELSQPLVDSPRLFRDFYVPPHGAYADVLAANEFSDRILRQMGKLFHIVLADLAAPSYDSEYGAESFGTMSAMSYEESIVGKAVGKLRSRSRAVDLGCGTGRHSFYLAKYFSEVHGYDFSSGMIEQANKRKRANLLSGMSGDVNFAVRDVEDEPLDFDVDSVDLVLGSFGMGSFVDDLTTFLIGIKEQLKPGGQLILSFYNSEALLYRTPPPWRDSSLSATLVPDHDELEVSLPTGDRFRVFCRAYEYHKLKSQLSRIFDVVQITTCPAFSSFLPADYFSRGPGGKLARKIMAEVDRDLARRESLPIGAYFTAVCAKQPAEGDWSRPLRDIVAYRGQEELTRFLQEKQVDFSIFVHERVRNVSDVQRRTGVGLERMAKAILIVVDGHDIESDVEHVVVVLQGSLQIDVDKVSTVLKRQHRQWRFATQKEVKLAYGLEIGGVPPFGYSEGVRVIMDHRLARVDEVICGIGDPTHSVRLGGRALADICNAQLEDIAEVVDYGS